MITAILPLLGAWALAVVSPGPDFAVTLRTAAGRTRRAGLWVATGVVTGIACWALLALLGLSALLDRYQHLYQVVRAAGATFLIVYGLITVWHAWRGPSTPIARTNGAPLAPPPVRSPVRHWRLGLLTNLANPKAVVFFGALFAGLLPAHTSTVERAVVLVIMLTMALTWFGLVALAASAPPITAAYRRARRTMDTVTGAVFAGTGAALLPR